MTFGLLWYQGTFLLSAESGASLDAEMQVQGRSGEEIFGFASDSHVTISWPVPRVILSV